METNGEKWEQYQKRVLLLHEISRNLDGSLAQQREFFQVEAYLLVLRDLITFLKERGE